MPGRTLRSLIVSVSAETSAYQREMARAGRIGRDYLRALSTGNREATAGWRAQEAAILSQQRAVGSLTGAVGGYIRAMAGALALGNLIGIADEWGQIASRLRIATRTQEDFIQTQTRLMDIGRVSFKAYSENAELFIRTVAVLREFGGTAEDALNMTEALSLGLAVSGTQAQATASVIDQVSKALQSGKLQGDGFNAVVTQAPRLLQALQDALGKLADGFAFQRCGEQQRLGTPAGFGRDGFDVLRKAHIEHAVGFIQDQRFYRAAVKVFFFDVLQQAARGGDHDVLIFAKDFGVVHIRHAASDGGDI